LLRGRGQRKFSAGGLGWPQLKQCSEMGQRRRVRSGLFEDIIDSVPS
jgi:hypothetical protein